MDTRSRSTRGGKRAAKGSGRSAGKSGAAATGDTTSSPLQTTFHALQGGPGQSNQAQANTINPNQGQVGPIRCQLMTQDEQMDAQQFAESEWFRPKIPEVAEAILDRATNDCKKLFEKARRTSLSWEEEWTLVFFKSTIAAEIRAGGDPQTAQCLRVQARPKQSKDVGMQTDFKAGQDAVVQTDGAAGFTGHCLEGKRLMATQTEFALIQDAVMQADGGPSARTLGRRQRKIKLEKKWKQHADDQTVGEH